MPFANHTTGYDRTMYEVLFVGAGPHCLTTLLRLLEPDADHSIDSSQRKTTPKSQVLKYWAKQRTDPSYRQSTTAWLKEKIAVIDPCGSWMGRWQKQFAGLRISHLRSSSAVHPDPLDTYTLVTYAGSQNRLHETQPLNHIHKTQDFHGPFHTPGSALFEDFCQDLIHRYCLDDLVTQDKVVSLTPVFASCCTGSSCHLHSSSTVPGRVHAAVDHWIIALEGGQQLAAKTVVIGIGSTNKARVPAGLQHLQPVHFGSSSGSDEAQQQALSNICSDTSELKRSSSSSSGVSSLCEDSYSFVEWLPHFDKPVSNSLRIAHDDVQSVCGSGSSSNGCDEACCTVSSANSSNWSSSSSSSCAPTVISPNSTPNTSNCGCDNCNDDGSLDKPQLAQQQQQQQLVAAINAAAAVYADNTPAAGTYPYGRLMHSWELVDAVAAAAVRGSSNDMAVASSSSSSCKPEQQHGALQDLGLLNPGDRVVIIGGGLTSAHLAQLAAQQWQDVAAVTASVKSSSSSNSDDACSAPITLLMRGEWRVKQFDVDVPYMGRLRQKKLQDYNQLKSFTQRLALIRKVLQGGSMPPEAAAWLQQLQQQGLLDVRQHSHVVTAEWDWQQGHWEVYLEDGDVVHAHRIWLATGSVVDVAQEALLQHLQQQIPIPIVAGLPAIQPSLEWSPNSGVYVLGAYAALQLGPGALNLAGAKTASVIMAKQLQKQLSVALPGSTSRSRTVRSTHKQKCDIDEQHQQQVDMACMGIAAAEAESAIPADLARAVQTTADDSSRTAAVQANCASDADLSFTPCTALKGADSLYLSSLASTNMNHRYSSRQYNAKSAAVTQGMHVAAAAAGAGLDGSSAYQCCGSCWKSQHMAARARWGTAAKHHSSWSSP